jgi:hypothetical protein
MKIEFSMIELINGSKLRNLLNIRKCLNDESYKIWAEPIKKALKKRGVDAVKTG